MLTIIDWPRRFGVPATTEEDFRFLKVGTDPQPSFPVFVLTVIDIVINSVSYHFRTVLSSKRLMLYQPALRTLKKRATKITQRLLRGTYQILQSVTSFESYHLFFSESTRVLQPNHTTATGCGEGFTNLGRTLC